MLKSLNHTLLSLSFSKQTMWSNCRRQQVKQHTWALIQRPFSIFMCWCVSSDTHTFSRTIPLAWEAPPKGLAFRAVPRWAFLYCLSCHFCSRRWLRSFLAVRRPRHFPETQTATEIDLKKEESTTGITLVITSNIITKKRISPNFSSNVTPRRTRKLIPS